MAVASRAEEQPVSEIPPDWPITNTEHGLLDRLQQVPIAQKTRELAPQAKLIEFLAGIMSGIEHLQDLTHRPRPLTSDPVVARAWGLEHFAHYSAVSRTLHAS